MSTTAKHLVLCGLLIPLVDVIAVAEAPTYEDQELAHDFESVQGTWEMFGRTIRNVKIIKGNQETIRRYKIETEEMVHEHSVEFQLSKTGDVRVFTFYGIGGAPDQGWSYVYKVDEDSFWEAPGLLQGSKYRNSRDEPVVFQWKRVNTQNDEG